MIAPNVHLIEGIGTGAGTGASTEAWCTSGVRPRCARDNAIYLHGCRYYRYGSKRRCGYVIVRA